MTHETPAGTCRPELAFDRLVEGFIAAYSGRDTSLLPRILWWKARFGERPCSQITDEDVLAALLNLESTPALGYRRSQGLVPKGQRAPATINRYLAALQSVAKFARRRRLVPKGWNPTLGVERRAEDNARVRYLSEAERVRLLGACKISSYPRLYALVLLLLVTGARRSEALGLRWRDVDLKAARASVGKTKNGSPHLLVLTPALCVELADETMRTTATRPRSHDRRASAMRRVTLLTKNNGTRAMWSSRLKRDW